MGEGGEARNHEAEVEAVMLVLWPEFRKHDTVHRRRAADVIAALDAVRRSPQGVHLSDKAQSMMTSMEIMGDLPPRSPQGEDHEAGIEAAVKAALEVDWNLSRTPTYNMRRALLAALPYLSRCPSPQGDTEKLVEALREIARYEHATAAGQDLVQYMVRTARDALAEFSSTTKDA